MQIDGGLLSEFPSLMSTDAVGQFGKKEDEPDELGVWRDMPTALQGLTKFAAGKANMTRLVRHGLGGVALDRGLKHWGPCRGPQTAQASHMCVFCVPVSALGSC